jgi:two-component system nitrogen regulation sensor histidine kinase NtrY
MASIHPVSERPARTAWRDVLGSSLVMGVGYPVAAVLTVASVVLGSSPRLMGPLGPASPPVLALLILGSLLLSALAAILGFRVLRLIGARATDPGARLHLRFVGLFGLAAVAPAVIVALFFGVLVTRGVDAWFGARVQSVVENSATVARSYVEEQTTSIGDHVANMAAALNTAAPTLKESPVAYSRYLRDLAADNDFSAAYIIDSQGRVLARADRPDGPGMLAPPASTFRAADEGIVSVGAFESTDLLRALYRLRGYDEAYLYVVKPLNHGIFSHLRETEASLADYRTAKRSRLRIQAAFALSYIETVLLVLVGAVWLGMSAAASLSQPIARLVQAAGRVAAGDLAARVEIGRDPEEIAVLSRAFNRMTFDLSRQQEALRDARVDAESRRAFTEAVLLGVSAGVIGLDSQGRVSAINRQAALLLDLAPDSSLGRRLSEIAPELAPVAERASLSSRGSKAGEAEEEVDVSRDGETRRLRARASHGDEGVVVTFDDITRLVAAQRNAAWKDVARRIAHEIKNPLTPIQLSAERLKRRYRPDASADPETFDRCTDTIIRQVGHIGRMVDEFSAFARMPAPKFAARDLVDLVRAAVFAQRVADSTVEITLHAGSPRIIDCDGDIIGQALANVLKNAGESVGARMADDVALDGRIDVTLVDGDGRIDVVVEDNGVGLPRENRDRLTEPYVTTREKGTGLGLAIVKRILEEHGGRLILGDRATGQGARVVLSFPLEAASDATSTPRAEAQA